MLTILENIFNFLFSYGLFSIIYLWGIIACILGVISLFALNIEVMSYLFINTLCSYWFVHYWITDKSNYANVVVSTVIFLIVAKLLPFVGKMHGIPVFILLLIYIAVAIWGL